MKKLQQRKSNEERIAEIREMVKDKEDIDLTIIDNKELVEKLLVGDRCITELHEAGFQLAEEAKELVIDGGLIWKARLLYGLEPNDLTHEQMLANRVAFWLKQLESDKAENSDQFIISFSKLLHSPEMQPVFYMESAFCNMDLKEYKSALQDAIIDKLSKVETGDG